MEAYASLPLLHLAPRCGMFMLLASHYMWVVAIVLDYFAPAEQKQSWVVSRRTDAVDEALEVAQRTPMVRMVASLGNPVMAQQYEAT
eukprot:5034466-Prymnesium_polylepis.1